ncbi:MAG TPA: tyrosine-type recombinase/integrase [Vicinamibacterales bacterium]|nr:tyrosine-type recombinase/integrase [Vicinamibacterales bacterium]
MVRKHDPDYVSGRKGRYKIQPPINHPAFCGCSRCGKLPDHERGKPHTFRTIKRASHYPDDRPQSAMEARRVKAEEEARLVAGGDGWAVADRKSITVAQIAKAYVEEGSGGKREEQILRLHVVPELGTYAVTELKPILIRRWQRRRIENGASPDTVNREWNALRAVLNFAEREELVERNPIPRRAIALLESQGPRRDFFEPEEWNRLLAGLDDERAFNELLARERTGGPVRMIADRAYGSGKRRPESDASQEQFARLRELQPFMRAMLYTCARVGELVGLRWKDVDLRRGSVTLYQEKTKKEKVLPIAAPLMAILEARPRGLPHAVVFTRSTGEPFYYEEVLRAFRLAMRIAGIQKKLVPHSIRHTVQSWLAIVGVPEAHRKEIAGHSRRSVTDGYSHLTRGSLVPVMATLARIEAEGFREEESVGEKEGSWTN